MTTQQIAAGIEVSGPRTVTGWLVPGDGRGPGAIIARHPDGRELARTMPEPVAPGRWSFALTVEAEADSAIAVTLEAGDGGPVLGHAQLADVTGGIRLPPHAERDEILAAQAGPVPFALAITDPGARSALVWRTHLEWFQLFDAAWYARTYGAQIPPGGDPLTHYIAEGAGQGHWPNAVFDPSEYRDMHPVTEMTGIDPVLHYLLFGFAEDRQTGSHFDAAAYVACNPDVRDAGLNPLYHYLAFGRHEGRSPTPSSGTEILSPSEPVTAATAPQADGLRTRGTVIFVTHDLEIGGAQDLLRSLIDWFRKATRFDLRIVALRDGRQRARFETLAPLLILSGVLPEDRDRRLAEFAGDEVQGLFLNTVASAPFYAHWPHDTPALCYVHELQQVIDLHPGAVDILDIRCSGLIAGSGAVRDNLCAGHGIDADRVQVIHDFVSDATVAETGPVRRALGLPEGARLVVGCGSMNWRKAPGTFIEVAARMGDDVRFVWVGDGPDLAACQEEVDRRGLGGRVTLLGYREDAQAIIQAADAYLLTSVEDPFPLTCLMAAAAGVPVICFEEAGGMPEFVARGPGQAVPFGDAGAMAAALERFLTDPSLAETAGAAGRRLVAAEHTVATTAPRILDVFREVAGLAPQVSVVVPNYNCGPYLPERLETIYGQAFRDFEVILLDDASTDGSRKILAAAAARHPATRLVRRRQNSGSPFVQWLKGMGLARADLIWMAEADDACEADMLGALVDAMADRNVFLAHAGSVPVGADGAVLGDYAALYLDRLAPGRWRRDSTATDHAEAAAAFAVGNIIPNASAVVFRRFDPEPAFVEAVSGMRMCGDWYFYLRMLRGGGIAHVARPLNRHRRHTGTVTHATEGSLRYFDELAATRAFAARTWAVPEETVTRADAFTVEDLDRFGITDPATRDRIAAASRMHPAKEMPSLMVVVGDLGPGGGQLFGIRLANAWMRAGGRVILLNAGKYADHPKVRARIDPRVPLFDGRDPGFSLGALIAAWNIDVVHSSLWWADRFVGAQVAELPEHVGWTVTMHGCHETLLDLADTDDEFPERFRAMLERVDLWVPTADKNQRVFDVLGPPSRTTRIANGYEPERGGGAPPDLELRDDALHLLLASRAIPEKGWFAAVEAVALLNAEGLAADLVLVGEGPAAETLRQGDLPDFVHLTGHLESLDAVIAGTDIALLPTWFSGESQPLVILECLARGVPVVATDHGEIASMLTRDGQVAGRIIPLQDGRADAADIAAAVRALKARTTRTKAGRLARQLARERFGMDTMLAAYGAEYRAILAARSGLSDGAG